jgi:hypothetical protein
MCNIRFQRYFCFSVLLLIILHFGVLSAQKVTVSNEINVRTNYAYDILPNIGENILFYHDRGSEHVFEIYDQNFRYKRTKELFFEKKNAIVLGVTAQEEYFSMVYSYKDEGFSYIRINRYDAFAELIDSSTLISEKSKILNTKHRFIHSDDKSKILLFAPSDGGVNLLLIDNVSLRLMYGFTLIHKDFNFKEDFKKILVNNNGDVYIAGKKDNYFNRKNKDAVMCLKITGPEGISTHIIHSDEWLVHNLMLAYDSINDRIIFGGLVSKSDETSSSGYFMQSYSGSAIPAESKISPNFFSLDFLSEFYGKKPGKVKELTGFFCSDMVIRRDGGVILITELQKQFTRRAPMTTTGRFGEFVSTRGFVDYYHEDIILLAMYQDGREHWKRILFKKQFSQDDDGIFSSYFLFKTPSRLRLVYNDEIKNNNTVSEYVIDPIGNYERNSVLSTEYQNLKLRFRDAIQIAPNSIIVPSEKSFKINMVRIDYN